MYSNENILFCCTVYPFLLKYMHKNVYNTVHRLDGNNKAFTNVPTIKLRKEKTAYLIFNT
jgi:hypothetical protein